MRYSYFYDYAALLTRVLSIGYKKEYTTSSIERLISYSSYFQQVEKDKYILAPIITEKDLINSFYPDLVDEINKYQIFVQCMWAAESYLKIQGKTGLTFECIFLYIPLAKMYQYFPVYHEMDFLQIINLFMEKHNEQSVLEILSERFGYKTSDISHLAQIPYNTVQSLKLRRRSFKKSNVEIVYKLASLFKVRIETIAELEINE